MQNGFMLVQSILNEYKSKRSLPGNLEELAFAWNKMDIQTSTFSDDYETRALFPPSIPDRFHGMSHAKSALETIIPNILVFLRSRGHEWYRHRLPTDPLPEELAIQLANFKSIL
jgi:hypothetical protein